MKGDCKIKNRLSSDRNIRLAARWRSLAHLRHRQARRVACSQNFLHQQFAVGIIDDAVLVHICQNLFILGKGQPSLLGRMVVEANNVQHGNNSIAIDVT